MVRALNGYLVKQLPVDKECVVWLGELAGQEGEETAHLRGGEVRVLHHHLQEEIGRASCRERV